MADLDEAAINLPSDSAAPIDIDLSDETQDFRMLNHLSFLTDSQTTLPKRGEKDFEPNPTLLQADILSASREAMHNALSYPRLHHPKTKIVGVYAPDGPAPPPSSKSCDTITEESKSEAQDAPNTESRPPNPVPETLGVHPDSCVYVTNPKGQLFKTLGRADRWNRVWLLPEEALYLLERASLDIRWPNFATGGGDEGDIEDSGIPMSLQAAYACLVGRGGLTMERFSVFSGLKRLGYAVIRAPGWNGEVSEKSESSSAELAKRQGPGLAGIFGRFLHWLHDSAPSTALGPIVGLGIHRSYDDIYRKLAVIPWYDPGTSRPLPQAESPYIVVWHIYKPSTPFRKSAPPAPDFRIAVVNARTHTTIPSLSEIGALLESTPLDPPPTNKQLYVRIRHGYRNVILAVVDQGVVSYLRIADAVLGKEKLYESKILGGNKMRGPPRPKTKKR